MAHWEFIHDGWVSDFKHWYKARNGLVLLLRKHPDDGFTDIFKGLIKMTEFEIKKLRKEYIKVYGTGFKISLIKEDV